MIIQLILTSVLKLISLFFFVPLIFLFLLLDWWCLPRYFFFCGVLFLLWVRPLMGVVVIVDDDVVIGTSVGYDVGTDVVVVVGK